MKPSIGFAALLLLCAGCSVGSEGEFVTGTAGNPSRVYAAAPETQRAHFQGMCANDRFAHVSDKRLFQILQSPYADPHIKQIVGGVLQARVSGHTTYRPCGD